MAAGDKLPDGKRDRVVELLHEGRGVQETARIVECGATTVSQIAKAEGIQVAGAERTAAAHEGVKQQWAKRRAGLVDEAGDMAAVALERFLGETDARAAQAHATAFAILVDKAQLLSGGVTSRHEQLDAQRRRGRVEELGDELAKRRAEKEQATGS